MDHSEDGVAIRQAQLPVCLPSEVLTSFPSCAIQCINAFVSKNYQTTSCQLQQNLPFLCTQTTPSGLVFGEGALRCLVSFCLGNDLLQQILVYDICDNIVGAASKTNIVIEATIQTQLIPSTSAATITVASVTTWDVTSISMSGGVPQMTPAPTPPASTTSAQSAASMPSMSRPQSMGANMAGSTSTQSSGTAEPLANSSSAKPSLSTQEIAGIASGAGAGFLLVVGLLFFFFRRRRRSRRKAMAWPPPITGPTAPRYDWDEKSLTRAPSRATLADDSSIRGLVSGGRSKDKRQSFFRRSVRPEDIGVAISAKAASPQSVSSEQRRLKYFPDQAPAKLPKQQSLWPTPYRTGQGQFLEDKVSLQSGETAFEDDFSIPWPPVIKPSTTRDSVGAVKPPRGKRQKAPPQPLRLNPVAVSPPAYTAGSSQPLPLTPTYDNGNVGNGPKADADRNTQADFLTLTALPEESDFYASVEASMRQRQDSERGQPPMPMQQNVRQDSDATTGTEILDESTPDESDKPSDNSNTSVPKKTVPRRSSIYDTIMIRSPISTLQYPPIPRSAAVSRQAEAIPKPRKSSDIYPVRKAGDPKPPSRNPLLRNESSYSTQDGALSDSRLSDTSIQWPVPPLGRGVNNRLPSTGSTIAGPRASIAVGNRGTATSTFNMIPPPSDADTVIRTPNGGDLYFKLVM